MKRDKVKIVGLLIVKNERDIIKKWLARASKIFTHIVAIDNGSADGTYEILKKHKLVAKIKRYRKPFDESKIVPKLIKLAKPLKADWYVDIDADEFFPEGVRGYIEHAHYNHKEINIIAVDIYSYLNNQVYNIKENWRRVYKNKPSLFRFKTLRKLHTGKVPIPKKKRVIWNSQVVVKHYSVRSYKQGMKKYSNYLKLDTGKIQKSYEHIKFMAEALKKGDFTGIRWLS